MYEFNNLLPAPVVDELSHAIDHLYITAKHIKACYDATNARWDTFEAQNAPCSRWDDHDTFSEWFDSDEVQEIYSAYFAEDKRLSENLEWVEETIKNLEEALQALTYMDSDGLLPKR